MGALLSHFFFSPSLFYYYRREIFIIGILIENQSVG